MVEVIKSSFIPKKEMKKKIQRKSGSGVNLFFLIALIIFLATIIGAAGMYFWKVTLQKQIKSQAEVFHKNAEKYGVEAFKAFIDLDKRINVGQNLLNKHYSIKPIFDFLERYTIPDITYNSMDLKEEGNLIKLKFKGQANEFADIVRQKDLYVGDLNNNSIEYTSGVNSNPNIQNFMFTNITRSKEDKVAIFDMSFEIDKKYLTKKLLLTE